MNNVSPLRRHGSALLRRGYPLVPIKRGYKYPKGLGRWETIRADQAMLDKWLANGFSDGGVGVLTRHFPAVDIDVHDPEIVQKLVAWCASNIGATVQRVGAAPKTLLAYRTTEPFSKIASARYADMFGDEHRLEILGDGQQYVAYAVHPDTGREYCWGGEGIAGVEPDDLPVITAEQGLALLDYFYSIIPEDWVEIEAAPRGRAAPGAEPSADSMLANIRPKIEISTERLRAALERIDPDCGHDDWFRIGMALHHQFEGSDEGFELWDEWSAEGVKYKENETRARWKSFGADLRRVEPVTAATILKLAGPAPAAEGGGGALLDQFLARYVFVEHGNLVCDLRKPPHVAVSRLDEFRNATANIRHEVPDPSQSEPDRMKIVPVHGAWMVSPDRKGAQGVRYAPGREMYFRDDLGGGLWWVNEFNMPAFGPSSAGTAVFREHMAYLFPNEREREWFIDWMAFNLQRPERRCKVTPLHVSRAHGTGRGWVVELMGRLLGPWNCTKTKMGTLSGEGSSGQFQDYLNRSLFCAVEEVREGGKRYAVSDRIRDILTENYLEVNVKYGGKHTQEIFTNFFFMSNHTDALVLSKEDRRVAVFEGPDTPRDGAYYTRLYEWLEGPGVAALHAELMARDLSRFDWQRAMETPAKSRMIGDNQSETEQLFHEFMAAPKAAAMSFRQVVEALGALSEDGPMAANIDEGQLVKLLQHHAEQGSRMRAGGTGDRRVRPWVFDRSILNDPAKIKAAIAEAEKCIL